MVGDDVPGVARSNDPRPLGDAHGSAVMSRPSTRPPDHELLRVADTGAEDESVDMPPRRVTVLGDHRKDRHVGSAAREHGGEGREAGASIGLRPRRRGEGQRDRVVRAGAKRPSDVSGEVAGGGGRGSALRSLLLRKRPHEVRGYL